MKSVKILAILALICFGLNVSAANMPVATLYSVACGGEVSTMTLKVDKVVNSEKKADKLKKQLLKIEGVKDVTCSLENGDVIVKYDKASLGCCSKITSALDKNGWKYETVAEKKSCTKGEKKMCPSMMKKETNS